MKKIFLYSFTSKFHRLQQSVIDRLVSVRLITPLNRLGVASIVFLAAHLSGCRHQATSTPIDSADVLSQSLTEVYDMSGASTMGDSIRIALDYQKANYPASQLRDVYKNFMQDFFGPGHILNDTAASSKYLRSELAETKQFDGPDYEPTGFRGNFYRVNIGLIADGTISYDTFFDTFVNSVQGITPPDSAYWMNVWDSVDTQIGNMGWKFENEEADRAALKEQFSKGNFIVHHSKAYNDAVNFHYRIISRDNFEKIIFPLLQNRQTP